MATIAIDPFSDHIDDADSVHPFKLFKEKEYTNNKEGRLDLCVEHVRLLSSHDRCKNHTNHRKKSMSCNCLGFLDNPFYCEATGNWMVDFGWIMKRHDQQRVVIEKICHADSLAETFHAADQDSKNHIRFCLPFIMVEQEDDVVEDGGDRVKALQAMQHHKICKSALMELMNVDTNGGEPVGNI